jgi:hypothetical protein
MHFLFFLFFSFFPFLFPLFLSFHFFPFLIFLPVTSSFLSKKDRVFISLSLSWSNGGGQGGVRQASRFHGPRQSSSTRRRGRLQAAATGHLDIAYLHSNIATSIFRSFLLHARMEPLAIAYVISSA